MKITPLVSGTILTWKHLLVHGAPRGIRFEVPVLCFLLEHKGHRVLYDTGQKILDFVQDPEKVPFYVKVTEDETAAALLQKRGIAPSDIEYIILSHIHSDHIAGLEDFPSSKVILQAKEGAAPGGVPNGFLRPDGELDLFGDGALRIIPTFGHTPGHQSVLARVDEEVPCPCQVLLCGDAAYTKEALDYYGTEEERQEKPQYFRTLDRLRSYAEQGILIRHSHELP